MLAIPNEITDAEILQRLEAGEGLAAIAFSRRLATAVLQGRLRRLRERLPGPLNPVEELRRNFDHLAAVRDGCLHLLASPEGAGLDLGPHDFDLEVTVSTGTGRPTRRRLTDFALEAARGSWRSTGRWRTRAPSCWPRWRRCASRSR